MAASCPENIVSFEDTSNVTNSPKDLLYDDYEEYNLSVAVHINFTAGAILLEEYPPSLIYFGVVCLIAFVVIGIPGNAITIAALLKSSTFRKATSAFIINLCFADILYCSFTMPLFALTLLHRGWPYGEMLCVTFAISRHSNAAVLLLTLISITVNRYVLIVHPKLYYKIYTRFTITLLIVFTWIMPFVLLAPTAAKMWGSFSFDPQLGECTIVPLHGKSSKSFVYIFLFCLPSVVFIFCYARIFCTVRNSGRAASTVYSVNVIERNRERSFLQKLTNCWGRENAVQVLKRKTRVRKELRLLRVIFVIFLTFIICYFPISIVKILQKEQCLPTLNILGYIGQFFSACVNPIIYVVISGEYRKAYKNLCFRHYERNDVDSVVRKYSWK